MSKLRHNLRHGDAILDIIVQPTAAFKVALGDKAAALCQPVTVPCIVDTGFNGFLALDQSIVKRWRLKTRNFNKVDVFRRENEAIYDSYAWEADVAIKFPRTAEGDPNVLIDPVPATLVEFFENKQTRAMLGQEFLRIATLVYDGPRDVFTLAFSRRLLRDYSVQFVS